MIRVSRSVVGPLEAEAVSRVILEDGYLGMGREVDRFEEETAAYLGVPRPWVSCVSTGTSALHLAVAAVTDPGDEVLVQSLTFVASFQAISGAGAIPVPCEVRPETVTIDLEDAAKRLTPRTRAIMPVHYASNPGNLDAVYDFARQHRLRVVEDAAHAFGCTYKGRKIGSFGDVACFSFDGIKNITSGEGGAVVASDQDVAQYVRDARLLGVQKDSEKRFRGERSWEFDVAHQGYRYHMSNIMAAIGRVQLKRLPAEFEPARRRLARRYRQRLADAPFVELLEADLDEITPHIQPVKITGGLRDGLQDHLESQGIQSGFHYKPNHLLTFYGGGKARLPVTEAVARQLLTLPLHPGMDEKTVDTICDTAIAWLQKSA